MAHNTRQTAPHNRNGFIFSSSIIIAICIAILLATNAFAESFTYDKSGNRINNGETYNANNELLQSGSATYTHDANGNITSKTENGQTTTFIYDVRDKLAQVQLPDGRTIAYTYDPFGRRIKKDLAGDVTYYVYSDEGVIGEYDENGNPKKTYAWQPDGLWGTNPVAMEQNGNTYYYQNDHLGTPQRLTDENGTTVWQATYSAFGQATVATNSTIENNLRFPGQYFDKETELHYNWNRYYDAETGRYTQVDPVRLVGGLNLYAYALRNPYNLIDEDGLNPGPINPGAGPFGTVDLRSGNQLVDNTVLGSINTLANISNFAMNKVWPTVEFFGSDEMLNFYVTTPVPWDDLVGGMAGVMLRVGRGTKSACDKKGMFLQAANAMDRSGLTKAGRALQKHGSRGGSVFPCAKGNPNDINKAAEKVVNDIINSSSVNVTRNTTGRFGEVIEIVDTASRRGIRFSKSGEFIGFLEP